MIYIIFFGFLISQEFIEIVPIKLISSTLEICILLNILKTNIMKLIEVLLLRLPSNDERLG